MVEWKNGIAKLTLSTPFSVGDVHTYLIKGDRLTLVDAGIKTEGAWQRFKDQLAELQLTPEDIEQVILTHHHPDHVGLIDYLPSSIEVYAHPLSERWLGSANKLVTLDDEFYSKIYSEFGVPERFYQFAVESMSQILPFIPDVSFSGFLHEGDTPLGLGGWEVIETHGHAQGHIALWREDDGSLVSGDVLLAHISPNPFLEPPHPGEKERPKPQLQYNESLKRLSKYPISTVFAGHGKDITDVNLVIEKTLESQHNRAMKVKTMLEHEPKTAFEICQCLFPTAYEREVQLTISETAAQLDYLFSLDEITVLEGEQSFLYTIK
jgi:glyoxylase-like metal-dependent hydrolase (beta-lactamase superfamily II)